MKEYYLGIDIGTYESRGMLIDENMIPVADCSVTHGMDHPQEGWFEHDADKVWWGDFCKLCRLLLEKSNIRSDEIRCVGTSALGTDCLPVDKDCNPLRPAILYGIDSRAEEEIKWLTQYYGDDVKKMFGHPICTGDTATKILWLKNHEPEVYEKTYKLDRYYLTGNSIDFALNYKDLGGDVTEMTILGNDVFADALEERLKEREIPLRILKRTDRPTAAAKMDLVDGDKKHLHFEGNAMEEIELQDDDLEFVKQFDIIYAERWAKVGRYIKEIRQEGQIWVYDFSKRLEQESNDEIIPYLDYAFFSHDRDDEYIRNFMVKTNEKGAKTVVAMLGEYGSLAYENGKFYKLDAEKVEVVNTVGAGDSYIAAFTYGVSLGEDIMQCMRRGRQRATEIIQQFNPYK